MDVKQYTNEQIRWLNIMLLCMIAFNYVFFHVVLGGRMLAVWMLVFAPLFTIFINITVIRKREEKKQKRKR